MWGFSFELTSEDLLHNSKLAQVFFATFQSLNFPQRPRILCGLKCAIRYAFHPFPCFFTANAASAASWMHFMIPRSFSTLLCYLNRRWCVPLIPCSDRGSGQDFLQGYSGASARCYMSTGLNKSFPNFSCDTRFHWTSSSSTTSNLFPPTSRTPIIFPTINLFRGLPM